MSLPRTLGRLASCGAFWAAACQVDDPPALASPPDIETMRVYESDHVTVFAEPSSSFCRGDGARMDAHIERLSTDLAIEEPPNVSVYLVGNDRGALIADWCFGDNDTLGGCFRPWIVVAKAWAVPHELNHVVLRTLNPDASFGSRFWYEAYASTWQTGESRFGTSGLAEQAEDAAYDEAGHLVRWLLDDVGVSAVQDFYGAIEREWDAQTVDSAFEQHFGVSYADALAAYEADMPAIYPGYGWCDDVEVIEVPLGETQVTLRADCGAADTYALAEPPIEGMYIRRILRLPERADLQIEYSSEAGVLNRHPCLETPVVTADDPRLSGDSWYENIGSGVPPMGLMSTMDNIEAGDNLFEFVVPAGGPVEVEAVITAQIPAN